MRCVIIHRSILLLIAGVLSCTLVFAGQQRAGEEFVSLDFDNVELATVIKYISEVSGKVILFNPNSVKGKVTVIAPGKIPKNELWPLFQSILELQGYTTVASRNVVKIIPSAQAKTAAIEVRRGAELDKPALREEIITRIVPLQYARAQELVRTLAPLVSPQGHIAAYQPTNALIITDRASNVARLLKLITGKEDVPQNQ